MKIVVSPAKSLDFESKLPTEKYTQPDFLPEAEMEYVEKTILSKIILYI